MTLAAPCQCDTPLTFEPAGTCAKCGRHPTRTITASTWHLALAIGEYQLARRPIGDTRGHTGGRP